MSSNARVLGEMLSDSAACSKTSSESLADKVFSASCADPRAEAEALLVGADE